MGQLKLLNMREYKLSENTMCTTDCAEKGNHITVLGMDLQCGCTFGRGHVQEAMPVSSLLPPMSVQ